MLSRPEIYSKLASHFIGVRLDWEQGNHYRDKFGFILGTGDQLFLDPSGKLISPADLCPDKPKARVFGRNGCDITPELLDAILARCPPRQSGELNLEWFFWPSKTARNGRQYPVSHQAIAGYARLPIALVEGPLPPALRDRDFLEKHLRQFIWVRGKTDGPARAIIRRVEDGLRKGLSTELAALSAGEMTPTEFGDALDAAWLEYMKDRPLTARGYVENPHGGWMRSVKDQMLQEDDQVRALARAGKLRPPGR